MNQATLEKFLEPVKERGGKISLFFGTVVGIKDSTLVVQPRTGGTVYATTYVYTEVGDLVSCLAQGTTIIAFAAKDAKRLEQSLKDAGLVYTAGKGITISDNTISAEVTSEDIASVNSATSNALSVANSAKTAASKAQTTADNAVSAAKTAQTTADGKAAASHTHDDTYLKLSGGTVTGNISVERSGANDSGFFAKNTDSGVRVSLQVGTGKVNHGVWSDTQNKWLLHGDDSGNVYVGGINIDSFSRKTAAADVFKVGSVYLTYDSTFDPAKTFGGTWTKRTDTYLFMGITIWRCTVAPT